MTIKENINDMDALIISDKVMEAFEKYYDNEVVMQKNENLPIKGKEANCIHKCNILIH